MKIGKILAVAAVATVFAQMRRNWLMWASRNLMRFVLPEYQDCPTHVPHRLTQPTLRLQTLR